MGLQEKLATLANAAQYDLACACGGDQKRTLGENGKWIYPAALPNGGTLPILKVLQFAGCERNCLYCAQRSGGLGPAVGFSPDELARLFSDLVRSKDVAGLFLSSAIRRGPVATMDAMLATLERVRLKHRFSGFVHIKIIPGSEPAQIVRAMQLANRVSVNLEAPSERRLGEIAPDKQYHAQLTDAMRCISETLGQAGIRCRSHTTQFVVGAGGERDKEILSALWKSYQRLRLGRGYFSAFQPVRGTPIEEKPAAPAMREHRLYQSDFLFRQYGFTLDDLVFEENANLSLTQDPKSVWAARHPERFPLEINRARRHALLRVPGLGPTAANRIVAMRRQAKIHTLEVLKQVTPRWRTAAPYLLFDGKRRTGQGIQLPLF